MAAPFSYKNDSDEDTRVSPEETAKQQAQALHEQEQQGGYDRDFADMTSPENFSKDGKSGDVNNGNDSTDAVRNEEEKGGWTSSYGGSKSKSGKGISKLNFKAVMKKRGPLAAVLTLVLGGGIGASVFFAPALLLVQIQESFLNKFNTQDTSMTIRTNKILVNKLVGDTTSGSCGVVPIACRFSRPSNRLLTNLEKNGVVALDKSGNQITKTGLFQTDRPASYKFNGKTIDAKNFASELSTNSEFRAAFHKAYNPKFVGFTDSVFGAIKSKFGFDTSNKAAEEKGANTKDNINKASAGEDKVGGNKGNTAEAKSLIARLLGDQAAEVVDKIGKAGKGGDTVGIVAASVCAVGDIPKLITTTVRVYQISQVVNYSMQFLIAGSALKAGTITTEQAAALGALLTTAVAGKTAMDSFGMKYAMYGTTATDSSYKKFVPGNSVSSAFGGGFGSLTKILSSDAKNNICNAATNPATGAAINVALAANAPDTLGASLLLAGINIGAGLAISAVVGTVVVPLVKNLVSSIDVTPLLKFFVGDLTQNLAGQDVGNAITSGASNMMSLTASAGGNAPLSTADALAYNDTSQQVQLAYAQEDRATLSPLDATNSNTMVGSIVSKLVPYLANIKSVSSAFTSLASIPFGSISSIFGGVSAKAAAADQYSMCDDPNIQGTDVAATPFCAPVYGVPPQYLNIDPQTVVDKLVADQQIDPQTGEPNQSAGAGSLYEWLQICGQGDINQAKNCEIPGPDKNGAVPIQAYYSLYTIDHRIQKTMDGEDTTDSTAATTTTGTAGATIDQAHIYDDSTSIACAAGTTDAGTEQGYYNGNEINIRVCSIPNTTDENHANGPAKVNSRISGAALALIQGLTASSANGGKTTLRVADSFRTNAEQQTAFNTYGSPRAAKAGFSNHQMGLAIDFQLGSNNGATRVGDPVYDWLAANAATYGFAKLSSEAWHWQAASAQGSATP